MNAQFLYKNEFGAFGSYEAVLCGLAVEGWRVRFTGACEQIERFGGITAEEMAVFAGDAESVHFERELVYLPVRGTGLNEKAITEEISVLTVRAISNGEVVNTAQISRVVSRW